MGRDTGAGTLTTPMPMRYGDIWRVARTWDSAFEADPLLVYLRAGAKPRRSEMRAKLFALRHLIQTVDSGNAFIMAYRTTADRPGHSPLGLGGAIHHISDWIDLHYLGAEQKRRLAEYHEKAARALKEALGERVSRMTCVNILATTPECRRRGHGGALLESVNRWADSAGQAVYLHSSNPVNERFYAAHGYRVVGAYCLGGGAEDSGRWGVGSGDMNKKLGDGEGDDMLNPILVQIMLREPQPAGSMITRHHDSFISI